MSLQDALNFIQKAGKDDSLKDRIRARGLDVELEEIVKIGTGIGFDFTAEELRTAFTKDWAMRRFFYGVKSDE
jgi:predicted ribosomally synthesized peptide with nif11-like leader